MSSSAFNPLVQTAKATLSSVRIGDVGFPEVIGLRAEDLCSRDALLAMATAHGLVGLRPHRLADDIRAAATSHDSTTRRAANATIAEFGRRLGALIATLRHPATADEQGDTAIRRQYLLHWLAVDRIWLAGGLLAAGPAIAAIADEWAAHAAHPCRVAFALHPVFTPLLGAARLAGDADLGQAFAVADLGQTSLKAATVKRNATAVTELSMMEAAAAPTEASADAVEDAVAAALSRVIRRAAQQAAVSRVRIVVSIAAYVCGGLPVDDGEGIYGCLAQRAQPLARRLAADCGVGVSLTFVHDSTAAAIAGSANSATLTTGTWPGAGFHPGPMPLLDLASDLTLLRA